MQLSLCCPCRQRLESYGLCLETVLTTHIQYHGCHTDLFKLRKACCFYLFWGVPGLNLEGQPPQTLPYWSFWNTQAVLFFVVKMVCFLFFLKHIRSFWACNLFWYYLIFLEQSLLQWLQILYGFLGWYCNVSETVNGETNARTWIEWLKIDFRHHSRNDWPR